ncbi:hypothetical protein I2I05_04300 [Hymenobacter sp. BT683]|uniref:Uncharacterized protein n=1 Tax=Hymenobacter jeongseonensis TaxID=2791027 RepID=A0ABS0IE59_9BACT|nr:hypothetical protein [Hymenobacter jeongseonensis]MBF9236610.1 hypothetical protein [Hymenobacter jeongseonensis]
MALTFNDFKKGTLLYRGNINEKLFFNGKQLFKLKSGEYFQRTDSHTLSAHGYLPKVEVYNINGNLVLAFLDDQTYTFVERVDVIENQTKEPFTGFENGKLYELQNGQTWKQMGGPYAPNHISSGYVKILNNNTMMVDNWDFFPQVILVSTGGRS